MSTSPDNDSVGASADDNNATVGNPNGSRPSASTKKFACVLCRRRKLKCDSAKPACGTCSRLKHNCNYQDDGPKKPPAKRRNIKDLEARILQVEGKLAQEKARAKANAITNGNVTKDFASDLQWNDIDPNMDWDPDMVNASDPNLFGNGIFAQDPFSNIMFDSSVLPMGIQEPLPPQEHMDEMFNFFFTRVNPLMPCVHEGRFRTALQGPPHMRPVVCLRYVIFALVATIDDKYSKYKDVFYQRARMYIEADELKGHGESFITVQHAQTWMLLSNYEVRNTAFPRAWMSSGRAVKLCQMMGLDRLDSQKANLKQTLPPARDWVELEERRRTFWGAYCSDRWSSAGTGWAMTIVEEDVMTNLPSSEEAFKKGVKEDTLPLQSLFTVEGAQRLSSYAGVVFMAMLFGHNIIHMHRAHVDDRPEDYRNGEFWRRHRKMDNVLATTLFSLPPQMRLVHAHNDPNIVLVHMNMHSSTICLHQAAVLKAEEHNLGADIISRSRVRCSVAADEIVNIMRLCCHVDLAEMNPWVCFSLYVAAQVFLEICKRLDENADQARSNLEFVISAMRVIRHKHPIVEAFLIQLKMDLAMIGLGEAFFQTSSPPAHFAEPSLVEATNGAYDSLPRSEQEVRDREMWRNRFADMASSSMYAAERNKRDYSGLDRSPSTGKSEQDPTSSTNLSDPNDTQTSIGSHNLPTRPSRTPVQPSGMSYPVADTPVSMYPRIDVNKSINEIFPQGLATSFPPQKPTEVPQYQEPHPQADVQADVHSQLPLSPVNQDPSMGAFPSFDMTDPQFFNTQDLSDFNFMAMNHDQDPTETVLHMHHPS